MNNHREAIATLNDILAIMRTEYTISDSVQRIVIKRDAEGIKRVIEKITRAHNLSAKGAIQIEESPAPEFIAP
jgi:hypothetical protein